MAREQHGASTENLPEETYGHVKSAFCDGMAATVTAAHHFIWAKYTVMVSKLLLTTT